MDQHHHHESDEPLFSVLWSYSEINLATLIDWDKRNKKKGQCYRQIMLQDGKGKKMSKDSL